MKVFIPALLFIFGMASASASDSATFHDRVVALYSFSPHTLDHAVIEAKSKDLDGFWSSVAADGPAAVEDLRKELARPDASPFFSYDGAKLLLSLSKTREDRALALSAMSRADLRDLQPDDYFRTIQWFAINEFDTSDAAFKILDNPNFQVFIVQHALTLDQQMCLVYLLLPTKEQFYLEKTEKRLFIEKDVTAQKSLLSLIADTVTKSGDDALVRFAASADQPEESRKYAQQIIKATREMGASALFGMSLSSYDSLKEQQRKLFARVSDEST